MDTTFTRIEGRSRGYWIALLVMAGFAAAGTVATFVLMAKGLYLTGMTNRIPWGIQVTFADYYIGLSAGAMLVSGLYGVFGKVEYKPFARIAAFLGMLFLFAGLLSILTDQGRVDRALSEPISHFNLMSLFSINPFLYFGNIVLCIIYLYALIKEKPRLTRVVAVIVVGWGFVLHTGTGAILGFIPRELHQSALLPMCFLAAALASGMGLMILVIVTLFKLTKRKLDERLVCSLGKYLGVFALVVIYFLLVDIAYRFYLIESREEAKYFLFGGFHSVLFWFGLMLMGCIVPIMIIFHPKKGKQLPWVVASAILVVFGVWCERYVLVFPGQTNPPDLFPGMQITSSELVEGPVTYAVTWYEVFQILGVLGVLGILFVLGLRWFRLTPKEAVLAGSSGTGAGEEDPAGLPMRTLFIGGGRGCREILELVERGQLGFPGLEVVGVADVDAEAPALRYARRRGLPAFTSLEEALAVPRLDVIVELTGSDQVLAQLRAQAPPGTQIVDHVKARVLWDLDKSGGDLRQDLRILAARESRGARARAELQDTLDAIPSLVVVFDREMRVVRVNERFERVTGKWRDTVHGRLVREVFDTPGAANWAEDFANVFEQVMSTGMPASVVRAKETHTGRRGHFQITGNPIFDEDLEIAEVVETAADVTELVMLKRETEDAARRFQQITDAVHGLITIKDLQGRYQMVNPWVEKVVGIPREEMIGKTAAELFGPETAETIERLDRETIEAGGRHVSEEVIEVGSRERFFVSERLPLTDYKGHVVGVCCVSQDQTRRRQLQQHLVQSEQLAAVGKLAAGVAHEINNPLSGILAFAEDLLLYADEDDPARDDYEVIVNETLRCRRIVKNLLEFSRQRGPRRRRIEMRDLVARVLPLVERQASFHDIKFEVSIAEGLPALEVDPQQIQQVLLNLIINARDAMEERGRITIHAEAAEDRQHVILSVGDTGCGIAEDQLERIFEPFYSTKGTEGHGLGLTAVSTVVERHGGRIDVESEVDVGTTFRVTLPAAPE